MNNFQNIMNFITISLCILMTGTIILLVNVNKDLEQQIFEVDNLQDRVAATDDIIGLVAGSVGKVSDRVADDWDETQNEIVGLKKRDLEHEEFIKDFWVFVNTKYPELWEKIRSGTPTNNSTEDITVDELNAEIERQIKILDREMKNAK